MGAAVALTGSLKGTHYYLCRENEGFRRKGGIRRGQGRKGKGILMIHAACHGVG
jgi:hypothetical protein